MANPCTKVLAKGKSKDYCRNGLMIGRTDILQHLPHCSVYQASKRSENYFSLFQPVPTQPETEFSSSLFFADFDSCCALLLDYHSVTVAVAAFLLHYVHEM